MLILNCGHGHYDKGHCGYPGCPNDFRVCPWCTGVPSWAGSAPADRDKPLIDTMAEGLVEIESIFRGPRDRER